LIAVDTNILVYAHRRDSDFHVPAATAMAMLAESTQSWAIAWSCLHEFIGIVTNPKVYKPPSQLSEAFRQIDYWMQSPGLQLISEARGYLSELKAISAAALVKSAQIHDARIAAICLQHGVTELWTADRDFSRFPKLKTRNPLVG
jgi:uncharacterized protein